MYVEDNEGYFPIWWWHEMRAYYQEPQMLCCPTATKWRKNLDCSPGPGYGDVIFGAWGVYSIECYSLPDYEYGSYWQDGDYGSYGSNDWITWYPVSGHPLYNYWWKHITELKGPMNIPVLLDCPGPFGKPHEKNNTPPIVEQDLYEYNSVRRFCVNRHNGVTNGLFADFSARRIGLKELWTLKWNRQYDMCGPWTKCGGVEPADWPVWMRGFRDY